MSQRVQHFILFASSLALAQGAASAAAQDATTSIKRDAEAARRLDEPSYQTREERLKSRPLDWNTTIGKPTRKPLSAAERKALANAKPGSQDGGAPDPKADEEARRLHPARARTHAGSSPCSRPRCPGNAWPPPISIPSIRKRIIRTRRAPSASCLPIAAHAAPRSSAATISSSPPPTAAGTAPPGTGSAAGPSPRPTTAAARPMAPSAGRRRACSTAGSTMATWPPTSA